MTSRHVPEEMPGAQIRICPKRLFFCQDSISRYFQNGVGEVIVNVVEKPDDWERRFTGRRPWRHVNVRGLNYSPRVGHFEQRTFRIPAAAFPGGEGRSVCLVVIEVRNLVKPSKDTLHALLKSMSPELDARVVEGAARVCTGVHQ